MAVPNIFANVTTSIPLSQLDANFATAITLGNTAVYLGNTTTTIGNLTLTNANVSSVSTPITPAQGGTGLATLTANNVLIGNGTSNVTFVAPGTSGNALVSNGTSWSSQAVTASQWTTSGSNIYYTTGSVGIGTSTPNKTLDVSYSSTSTTAVTAACLQLVNTQNSTGYYSGVINFCRIDSTTPMAYIGSIQENTSGNAANNIVFGTRANSATVDERMRINSSGNVGIGVTSISSWSLGKALEIGFVGNGINGSSQTQSSWLCNAYYDGSWKYGGTGKATLVQCDAGSINTLTATSSGTAGGAITWTTGPYVSNGGTSWTSSSDERLKNITGEIENALDKVSQLRAARFTWKSDADNKPQVGLIAQDVQAVLPEVVNSTAYIIDDETEYLGINYDQVIPLLVASIKDLKALVDAQATEIAELKAKVGA